MRQFFDSTVSPYFSKPSAQWDDIESDKRYYFDRFPTIRLSLLGEPVHTTPGGQDALEYDYQYSEIRKDGRALEGTGHEILSMHLVDGQWKIAGISERKAK